MRSPLLVLGASALILCVAACDSGTPPAATTTPASTPAAAAPAAPAAPAALSAATLAPLLGTWAASPESCGTPIEITQASFTGAENTCEISGWTDNGDGSLTAAMSCTGEGQTVSERIGMEPIFGPQGEGIRLSYTDRGGNPVTVFRCSKPRVAAQ